MDKQDEAGPVTPAAVTPAPVSRSSGPWSVGPVSQPGSTPGTLVTQAKPQSTLTHLLQQTNGNNNHLVRKLSRTVCIYQGIEHHCAGHLL